MTLLNHVSTPSNLDKPSPITNSSPSHDQCRWHPQCCQHDHVDQWHSTGYLFDDRSWSIERIHSSWSPGAIFSLAISVWEAFWHLTKFLFPPQKSWMSWPRKNKLLTGSLGPSKPIQRKKELVQCRSMMHGNINMKDDDDDDRNNNYNYNYNSELLREETSPLQSIFTQRKKIHPNIIQISRYGGFQK